MKEYSNNDIKVIWNPEKCIHAGECVKGLPQVFNRDSTPWINMQGASSEEIMSVVDRCPSGALTYKKVQSATEESDNSSRCKNQGDEERPLAGGRRMLFER